MKLDWPRVSKFVLITLGVLFASAFVRSLLFSAAYEVAAIDVIIGIAVAVVAVRRVTR